ncbi:phage tail protein [Lacticaseibacillus paracasei]|uniref:phage tail protein n=1 Tax=Lacticaseibacillus paracasei TaxID=1597 RepID=UPI003D3370E7
MAYTVDFKTVSTIGLESSPVAAALAGLRANEARYIWNKYKKPYITYPAAEKPDSLAWVNEILAERDLQISAKPLEVSDLNLPDLHWVEVYYQDGLAINVMYSLSDSKKRAVGFKLSDGMAVPTELEGKFKFARQKSKLAGTIRGSFFVIKGSH